MAIRLARTRLMDKYLGGRFDENRETGGRKFYNGPAIERIQKAGTTGSFDVDLHALTVPHARFDSPPFPISDMLIIDAKHIVGKEPADMGFKVGDKTFSGPSIPGEFSLGATQPEVHEGVAAAALTCNFMFGIGEGGCSPALDGNPNLMIQNATGLFGITAEVMQSAAAISLKMSQGAKCGMGGMLPQGKVTSLIRTIRGMPEGVDILSDAALIKSVEEMSARRRVAEIASRGRPIYIKVGVSHDILAIGAAAARAKANGIIIDCFGGTGAAPNIHRDHTGMPGEIAVALLHRKLEALGLRQNFQIIAAGRIDSPETALKLNLLGADAVLQGTAYLIAMGCKVINLCPKDCIAGLTAVPKLEDGSPKRKLDVGFATKTIVNVYTAFIQGWAILIGALGFRSPQEARGRTDLLHAVDMPPSLVKLLDISTHKESSTSVPLEKPQRYFRDLLEHLAKTGKPSISGMGRTTDLDPAYSNLDWLNHAGRTVIGPPFDSHRDEVELLLRLPGRVNIGIPLILEDTSSDSVALARERNTIVACFGSKNGNDSKRKIIRLTDSPLEDQVISLRASSGVLLIGDEISEATIRKIKILSPLTAVYVSIKATTETREEVIRLAKMGFDGVIIEGSLSMKDPVPIDVAISQADDALSESVHNGNILRRKVFLIAKTKIRSSRDIFALNCLGANAVIADISSLIDTPAFERRLRLLTGIGLELRGIMGASGLSMMGSIIANRDLLRADHLMDDTTTQLLGVKKLGL